jgi:hypothetical protein
LACGGMKGSSSVAGWRIPDPSFPVLVGIASGRSKILRQLCYQKRNNWRPIVGFVMRSRRVLPWNFASLAGCSMSLPNESKFHILLRTQAGCRSARGTSRWGGWHYWHPPGTATPGTWTGPPAHGTSSDASVWCNLCLSGNPGAECVCATAVHLSRFHASVELAVVHQNGRAFVVTPLRSSTLAAFATPASLVRLLSGLRTLRSHLLKELSGLRP